MTTETKKPRNYRRRADVQTPITSVHRLMDMSDVMDFTRLSEMTINDLIRRGEFPRGFSAVPDAKRTALRWRLADLERWSQRNAEKAQEAAV